MDAQPQVVIIAPYKASAVGHDCIARAAAYYDLSTDVLVAIRMQENGTSGRSSKPNKNGSLDLGPYQINEIHRTTFARSGVSLENIRDDECINTFSAAYLLAKEIQTSRVMVDGRPVISPSNLWKAIGNYHSATPIYHMAYRAQVNRRLHKLVTDFSSYAEYMRKKKLEYRQEFNLSNVPQLVIAERREDSR